MAARSTENACSVITWIPVCPISRDSGPTIFVETSDVATVSSATPSLPMWRSPCAVQPDSAIASGTSDNRESANRVRDPYIAGSEHVTAIAPGARRPAVASSTASQYRLPNDNCGCDESDGTPITSRFSEEEASSAVAARDLSVDLDLLRRDHGDRLP